MNLILSIVLIIASYLLGSISAAVIICRLLGLPDPREQGSGNPGATNVMRIGGKKAAALTLIGDFLKGLIPVLIAYYLNLTMITVILMATASIIGHLFPIFFSFKGGKGVATAFGCITGIDFQLALAWAICWLIIFAITRISALAALTAFGALPLMAWLITQNSTILMFCAFTFILILYRHKTNIKQMLSN